MKPPGRARLYGIACMKQPGRARLYGITCMKQPGRGRRHAPPRANKNGDTEVSPFCV
jgi:hypothetical protein